MISKNKLCSKLNADDLDDERIDQLIARYSNIRAAPDGTKLCENKNYSTSRTRKKTKLTASRNVVGHSGTLHICPIANDNYLYKFPSSRDSEENSEERLYHPIQITCHNICDSSNSNDADFSFSTTSTKRSKEDLIASKSKQVKFQDQFKNVDQQTSFPIFPRNKSCAEKTTYCRPLRNSYDRHFLCKMMERNAKLQLLLTKYVITRQKEKEKEKWNNYVNMLKIKNRCFRDTSKYFSSPSVARNIVDPLHMNDFYCTKYNLQQSDSYRETLHDLYDTSEELFLEHPDEYYDRNGSSLKRVYDSQLHCFPSTSRVKRTYKHRWRPDRTWQLHRGLYSPRIIIKDESVSTTDSRQSRYLRPSPTEWFTAAEVYPSRANIFNMMQSRNAQTHISFGGYDSKLIHLENKSEPELQKTRINEIELGENHIDALINEVENIVIDNQKHDVAVGNVFKSNEVSELPRSKTSIQNLENKIDKLIDVLTSFIRSLESKGTTKKSNDSVVIITDLDKNQSTDQISSSQTIKTKKKVAIVGNVMTNTSLCGSELQLTPSHYFLNMRLNKILHEEFHKSNKIRNEIEGILNPITNRTCAVEVGVDIPTKERSTEVTDSLAKAKLKESRSEGITIEDISHVRPIRNGTIPRSRPRPDQRIAVNTEPLGLLSLLRLSAEAVRQILSYVPSLSWYLTRLQHPVTGGHDYVCNICGAAFARPSQLHAHILSHDLGQARDCTVCRHTVDSRRSSQLFCCQYCGQRFARAYCCELHQQGCSRRLRTRRPSRALLS